MTDCYTTRWDTIRLSALDPSGLLDINFGNAGCAPVMQPNPQNIFLDLVRDASNRIVSLGTGFPVAGQPTTCRGCIARYLANGALDVGFNPAGLSTGPQGSVYLWPLAVGSSMSDVFPRAIVARPGSRLAAFADVRGSPTGRSGQILAMTPDGAPDPRFGPASTPGRVDLMVDGNLSQLGILAAVTPAGMAVVLSPIPDASTSADRTIVRHLIDDRLAADGFE